MLLRYRATLEIEQSDDIVANTGIFKFGDARMIPLVQNTMAPYPQIKIPEIW